MNNIVLDELYGTQESPAIMSLLIHAGRLKCACLVPGGAVSSGPPLRKFHWMAIASCRLNLRQTFKRTITENTLPVFGSKSNTLDTKKRWKSYIQTFFNGPRCTIKKGFWVLALWGARVY